MTRATPGRIPILWLVSLAFLAWSASAAAHAPRAAKVGSALGKQNRAAGRTIPLALPVSLQLGGSDEIVARGRLETDPSGASRLELASPRGIVERHLDARGARWASRDGRFIEDPRPFLPPMALMQAESAQALVAQLGAGAGLATEVGYGYVGDHDCFVLGSRRFGTSLWVDVDSLELVRIRRQDGVLFTMGPPQQFGEVLVPSWIRSETEEGFTATLRVDGAEPGTVPPTEYNREWLLDVTPLAFPSDQGAPSEGLAP